MMNKISTLTLTILLTCFTSLTYADIYKYTDKNGDIILSSQPIKGLKASEIIKSAPPTSPTTNQKSSPTSPTPTQSKTLIDKHNSYNDIIAEASKTYDIPVNFIKAVIKIESNFNPRALSYAGAMGLMQLMPQTAEHMGVSDPYDPRQNIHGGTKYLRRLANRYNGDINLVLSAYHAGPGNVDKYQGIPFKKTQQYIKNVYDWYKRFNAQTTETNTDVQKTDEKKD